MIRRTLIDLTPVKLNYYPFMISLDKFSGICNSVDDISTKICVSSKTKDINIKVFNMITNINESKTMVKHIWCDRKCKFNISTCSSNNETCQCHCKNYLMCINVYSWNHSTCICKNGKYLKSIASYSKIVCYEIIYTMDIVSTNVTNTIPTNVTSVVSTNFYKEVRYEMDC